MKKSWMKLESKSLAGYSKIRKGSKCWTQKLITSLNSFLNSPKISSKTNSKINGVGSLLKNSFPTLNGHKNLNGSNHNLSTIPLNKEDPPKPKHKTNKLKLAQMNKFQSHPLKSSQTQSLLIESN
jgi:hypothetical protein